MDDGLVVARQVSRVFVRTWSRIRYAASVAPGADPSVRPHGVKRLASSGHGKVAPVSPGTETCLRLRWDSGS